MKIKGQNLRVFVGEKAIAAAKSCTLHVSLQTEDSSTKDSTGDWAENEIVGKAWDISTESLVVIDKDETGETAEGMLDAICNATLLTLTFDQTSGDQNRTKSNTFKRTGNAYLTDFSLAAQNKQDATASCTFTGQGELKKSAS